MTYARLVYQPASVHELRYLLKYLRKQEVKQEFAYNTLSLILNAMRPKLKRELYSEFAQKLDGQQKREDERSGMEIVEDLKNMIKNRIKKAGRRK